MYPFSRSVHGARTIESVACDPQLRVCVGCRREWYSAAHLSLEPAFCDECGSPLMETLSTVVAAIIHDDGDRRPVSDVGVAQLG